jgi:hypothetical protein
MHVKIFHPAALLPGYLNFGQPSPSKRNEMQKNNKQRSTPYVQFEKHDIREHR